MVAPLIAGASRVVGNTKKLARRTKAGLEDPKQLRNTLARKRRIERIRSPLSPEAKEQQTARARELLPGSRSFLKLAKRISGTDSLTKKIIAAVTANFIFWSAIGFYVPQLGLWLFGIAGLGLESIFVLGSIVPGKELYMASWFIIMLIGVCTMIYAALMFTIRRVNCFDGWKGLIFIICLAGYMVIFINFIPFFVFWIVSVVLLQGEKEDKK